MKSMNPVCARTFFALVASVIAFAGAANAQTAYQGKFTLSSTTRWGQNELPAGDYTFSVKPTTTNSPLIVITDARGKSVGITQAMTADDTPQVNGQDCLMLDHDAKGDFVSQLRLASTTTVLGFAPHGKRGAKETGRTEAMRINVTRLPQQTRAGN
jgi:hypothetical protein